MDVVKSDLTLRYSVYLVHNVSAVKALHNPLQVCSRDILQGVTHLKYIGGCSFSFPLFSTYTFIFHT